jgi:hypothetical protein
MLQPPFEWKHHAHNACSGWREDARYHPAVTNNKKRPVPPMPSALPTALLVLFVCLLQSVLLPLPGSLLARE